MAKLSSSMPTVNLPESELKFWGKNWLSDTNPDTRKKKIKNAFAPNQITPFSEVIDNAVGESLATMLGGINIVKPHAKSLLPPEKDCVEIGHTKIVGGIRTQNFDLAYRPDGPRIVYDLKTLNDLKSVGKNWRNMINDLATESATVHTRFPYCIVGFIVVIPRPALSSKYEFDISRTLERLGTRKRPLDEMHLAEVVSLVIWDPATGKVDQNIPEKDSNIRIENFSKTLYPIYLERYKGLTPHGSG